MLPERVRASPGAEVSMAEESGASFTSPAPVATRGSTAATSRSTRPTKSEMSRHLRDSFASASRLSSIEFSARKAKPLMIAKIASATSSSTRVNPLLRHIGREAREHAVRIARIGDGEVHAPDRGVVRAAHGLVDHERHSALLGIEPRRGRRREDAPRAQLRDAVLRGPGGEQPLARLERAVDGEACRTRGGCERHRQDGDRDQDFYERKPPGSWRLAPGHCLLAPGSCPHLSITLIPPAASPSTDRKSTRLNSSHSQISYAVFCL